MVVCSFRKQIRYHYWRKLILQNVCESYIFLLESGISSYEPRIGRVRRNLWNLYTYSRIFIRRVNISCVLYDNERNSSDTKQTNPLNRTNIVRCQRCLKLLLIIHQNRQKKNKNVYNTSTNNILELQCHGFDLFVVKSRNDKVVKHIP